MPDEATVIFLSDGELESTELQQALSDCGFEYVCRLAASTLVESRCDRAIFPVGGLEALATERYASVPAAAITESRYSLLHVVFWHEDGYDEGLLLVTSLGLAEKAIRWYSRRFQIETLFSDQKSRGFHIDKSHISAPERLARLLLATSLAYLWVVHLGQQSISGGWYRRFHRTSYRLELFVSQ